MRNRKAILGSAILAIGGFGLASLAPAQTQNTPGQTQNQRNTTGTNRLGSTPGLSGAQDSMQQIKGVQQLFAHVTDAAVKANDFQQLKEYFSKEEMGEHNGARASGSSATSGGTSGLSARANTNRTGTSGSGTAGTARNESSAKNEAGTAGTASAKESKHEADTQALNQSVQRFEQAWKQKYGSDFTIQDPTLVYADITAADIMAGQAQAAGSQLRGSGLNGSSSNSTPHQPGSSSGTTGSATHSGSSTASGQASGNRSEMNEKEETINVPAVSGTQAVSVRVVKEGTDYKFAGNPNHLASSLQKHLDEAVSQKDRWPSDQKQAERLITQHVLMAISEMQMHHGNENAEPAGERIRGQSGTSGTSGTSGSSTTGNRTGTGR